MRTTHLLLGACAFALATPAHAADPAPAEQSTIDAADQNSNEIIVTATKRETSIQDVPISMQVVSGEALADNNINNIKELTTQVPGMSYIESPTVAVLQLRGFSSPANNPAGDQTVAVYKDGLYQGRARQFQAPFFDIERIEVLRGPQGSLLGKNTAAGAMSVVSAAPKREFHAGLTSTYLFNLDGAETNAFVTGPLSETVSARAAAHYYTTTKGWVYNTATGRKDPSSNIFSGRLSFDWHPDDETSWILRGEHSDLTYHGTAAANFPGTVPIKSVLAYRRNVAGVFGVEDGLKLKAYQASLTGNMKLGDYDYVSITGYTKFDATSVGGGGANTPEVFGTTLIEHNSQVSQEMRILSPTGGRFEWLAGLYVDGASYKSEGIPRYNLLGGAVNGQGHSYYTQKSRTISAYATGTLRASDELRGIFGLRYTNIKNHGTFLVMQDFGPAFGYTPGLSRRQSISESHLDPSVTVQYDANRDIMLYAAWARGSKGGTFQSTNRTVPVSQFALKPEKAESFEAGIKATFGGWLTTNISVYQLTIRDLQGSQYVGTPPTLSTVNVGKARSKGVEYVVSIRPTRGLTLSAVGAYTDGKFVDYPGAPCTFAQLASGCINGAINAAGRRLSAAKWSGTINFDYRGPITEDLDVLMSSDFNYRSRANIDANVQNPFFGYQDAFGKVNGRVGFGDDDSRWEVALVARNLFNKKTINSAIAWGPPFVATQTVAVRIDPARSIGLQFKLGL